MSEVTGTDVIRGAARNRAKDGGGLARLARDLSIPLSQLDTFTYHGGTLAPEALQALATDLFAGHAEFDPASNLLRSTNRSQPISMGIKPEPFAPTQDPVARNFGGHTPYSPMTPVPVQAKARRPGWVE